MAEETLEGLFRWMLGRLQEGFYGDDMNEEEVMEDFQVAVDELLDG